MRAFNRLTRVFSDWTQLLGLVLLMIVIVTLCVFAFSMIMSLFAVIIAVVAICWACGVPFTVKKNEVTIGYVRWFTFHRM